MFAVTDAVQAAMRTHQFGRTYGVASYQNRSVELQLEQSGSLTTDADGDANTNGTITVVGVGNSLVPKARDDFLAPYGQEVALFREVLNRSGVVAVTIPLGVFRITGNSRARESYRAGRVTDWEVTVDLDDRFRMLARAKRLDSKSPAPGKTMYQEIQRLSLVPVIQSVPDVPVPASMEYGDRLPTIRDLAELAGAIPMMTRQGALTLREKDAWLTTPTSEGVFDISATVPESWEFGQTDDFYNDIQAKSQKGDFVAYARETDDSNPLSVNRAGPVTYEVSSPQFFSQASTQAGANTALQRLMYKRSKQVWLECTPEALLLDLGDVGWMRDPVNDRAVFGEVCGIRVGFDSTETVAVGLIVAEEA